MILKIRMIFILNGGYKNIGKMIWLISILKTRLISVPKVRYEECQAFVAECQSEGRPRG